MDRWPADLAWPVGKATGWPRQLRGCADDESGLIYRRARYYEPGSGRFISEDPDMHGGNWFSFCANGPCSHVDESGRLTEEIAEAILNVALGPILFGGILGSGTETCDEAQAGKGFSAGRIIGKGVVGIASAALGATCLGIGVELLAFGGVAAIVLLAAMVALSVAIVLLLNYSVNDLYPSP